MRRYRIKNANEMPRPIMTCLEFILRLTWLLPIRYRVGAQNKKIDANSRRNQHILDIMLNFSKTFEKTPKNYHKFYDLLIKLKLKI
ncbi:hypothetical protein BpHYR1_040532 [Brachionus plicatilis]|uniref:Uncharacterized protein n=1 Tax=Brachionus plicatilis TaxID=10195 RepID=A0A3M7P120_BRAPC|nr:hypothetical protein BpHYR1_040532 [Brachionus plicatilis]